MYTNHFKTLYLKRNLFVYKSIGEKSRERNNKIRDFEHSGNLSLKVIFNLITRIKRQIMIT